MMTQPESYPGLCIPDRQDIRDERLGVPGEGISRTRCPAKAVRSQTWERG